MDKIKNRINKLREIINDQNKLYFNNQEENEITDELYDQLFNELKVLESKYPEYDDVNSPTKKVGSRIENTFEEVKYDIPMLSLNKVDNFLDFKKWFIDLVNKGVKEFMFELKFDGLAISLLYENGKLVRGSTRGDGITGENITATVYNIPNIPKTISINQTLEIRGEVILLKSGLDKINELTNRNYKNVRNAASGILRTKNPIKNINKYLKFIPYGFTSGDYDSHIKDLKLCESLGFELDSNYLKVNIDDFNDINEFLDYFEKEYFNKVNEIRDNLDFDIDGIVIKADLYEDRDKLGNKSNYPNWAVAFKFQPRTKITKLENVEWLLGNKGNITPRAVITPIEIGGTIITKPTLHNIEEIKRLDIKIGDSIVVSRRGDVIPKIEEVLIKLRTGNEIDISIPTKCPECNEDVVESGIFIRCDNLNCTGRQSSKIENYVKALEIDSFGPKTIDKLIEMGKINNIYDIYSLTVEDIANLDKMGEKSAIKIINNIEKSKNASLDKVILGLTIKNVGAMAGKDLANKYKTLTSFSKATLEELLTIEGMGDVIANNIVDWLNDNLNIINKLIEIGIGENQSEDNKETNLLNNNVFSFTGSLSISRKQMENIIINNGGKVSSIKKGINYLIIGNNAVESKIDKAKKLGAQIITELQFTSMLQ